MIIIVGHLKFKNKAKNHAAITKQQSLASSELSGGGPASGLDPAGL